MRVGRVSRYSLGLAGCRVQEFIVTLMARRLKEMFTDPLKNRTETGNGRHRGACHFPWCCGANLEKELQSELDLSRPLRTAEVSKVRIAGRSARARIKGAVGWASVECINGPIEQVERVHAELQPLALGDRKTLVQREIDIGVARTPNVANTASTK